MKEAILEIWKKLWAVIVPMIITLIVSPFNDVLNFQGIIVKAPIIKHGIVYYEFANTSTEKISNFNIAYKPANPSKYQIQNVLLDEVPSNKEFTSSIINEDGPEPGSGFQYSCASLPKGIFSVKIQFKTRYGGTICDASAIGSLAVFQLNDYGAPLHKTASKEYSAADYRYFHPFSTSVLLLSVLIILSFSIKGLLNKPKRHDNK